MLFSYSFLRRSFILFVFSGIFSLPLLAQVPSGTVSGTILDQEKNPLSYATVLIRAVADSAVVKAGFSDDAGSFKHVQVPAGNFFLEINFPGYRKKMLEAFVLAEAQELVLPVISLELSEKELNEVQIQAERPMIQVKPDMTVFNVEGTVNAVGENAFNLLRKAPGVVIDNNDNLMLLGKSGVRIYIDGKPSPLTSKDLANFLRSMQSDQIESFEIITNPSSKYDAEGNAGIINIKFKRDKNLGASATASLDYSAWINHRFNGSLSGNYRSKKISLFGSYGSAIGKSRSFMNLIREQVGTGFDQEMIMLESHLNHNFRAGIDWYLKPQHTLGFVASGFISNGANDNNTTNFISDLETDSITSLLVSNSTNDFHRSNYNFNLNYRFENKKATKLSMDLDYGTYTFRTESVQPNLYLNPENDTVMLDRTFTSSAPSDISINTFKTDYEHALLKGTFGAGMKISYVKTDNTFDFFNRIDGVDVLDTSRSNSFSYTENVNAAYVNYQRKFNKWAFQVGARGEFTNSLGELTALIPTNDERVERHYFNLFPSGGITYTPAQKHSFRLTYSRRIDRPNYQNLNPFQVKLDELSYMVGNPFLKPQMTHNFEIGHTFKYTLNTTLAYSITSDYFTSITDTTEGVRTFMTTVNLSTRKVATLSVSYPLDVTKWWSTFSNAGIFNVHNIADFGIGKEINLSRTSFNIFHQSTFKVAKGFSVQLSGFYNSPGIWGANFVNSDFWGIETGVVKKLFRERGTLKLGMSDIFFTMQWRGIQNFGGLYMDVSGGWESRQIKASYSHSFGNNQVKGAKKRKTGIEEESERTGGGGGGPGR